MDLLSFAQFSTMVALCDGTSFLLDLKQGAVGVLAGRGSMTLDAGVTGESLDWVAWGSQIGIRTKHISSHHRRPERF